jgi:hypothetical protein
VSGRERRRVLRADILAGRRRLARLRRPPFLDSLPRSRVRAARARKLRARVELRDGRVVTLDRRVGACR